MRIFKFVFISLSSLLLWNCSSSQAQEIQKLSPGEFKTKLAVTPNSVLLDVRTPDEFKGGHLDKAVNKDISSPDFEAQCSGIDKNKSIFVYCLAGTRSHKAALLLQKKGYTVYELKGGIKEWANQNMPVVK